MISVFLLLPAVFMGNPQTLANITARVYVSVTLVGILSAGTSWINLQPVCELSGFRHCLFLHWILR